MKKARVLCLVCISYAWPLYSQPTPQVIEAQRGPHHKVWQTVREEVNSSGQTYLRTNSYTSVGTGLHYWEDNQWKETKEEIRIVNGAAMADQGPHKIIFAANLNSAGAIDMLSPDGKRFRSHVIGLAYTDSLTGASVLIAEVKDSTGAVLPPNQVIYQDAFDGDVIADVHYTYTKGGFEQDVIILTAPPDPRAYGVDFDPATTRLEVWTEFIEIPEGQSRSVVLKHEEDPLVRQVMFEPDLIDERLDYGVMKFETGQAFPMGQRGEVYVPTGKSLEDIGGRLFLIEKVDYGDMATHFNALPQAQAKPDRKVWKLKQGERRMAQALPKAPNGSKGTWKEKQFAAVNVNQRGFVIDYTTINGSVTNYTFHGDATYYASASLNLYGTTVIEGGTVIKFPTNSSTIISTFGPIDCQTVAWHPGIFTAADDDTVGQTISGSSGNPSGLYANVALFLRDTSVTNDVHDLRIRFAHTGVYSFAGVKGQLRHSQVGPGERGIQSFSVYPPFSAYNCLMHDLTYAFNSFTTSVTNNAENCTFHGISNFLSSASSANANLTNCLLVAVTNHTQHTGGSDVVVTNNDAGFFQTIGAGSRYLAAGSPYRNVGTTNMNLDLLDDLTTRTTYPPQVLTNDIQTDTVLFPAVQRDADLPDLGYHYDPIDYAADGVAITNVTLVLTNGVVFGAYGDNGFFLHGQNGAFISQGTVQKPNRLVRYTGIQEDSVVWGTDTASSKIFVNTYNFSGPSPGAIRLRFTESYIRGAVDYHVYVNSSADHGLVDLELKDSLLMGGQLMLTQATNGVGGLTNNIFYRINNLEILGGGTFSAYNNLFRRLNGTWLVQDPTNNVWTFNDNLLDQCTNLFNYSEHMAHENNAYYSSTDFYSYFTTNVSEIVLSSLSYESGILGDYYQPTSSSLIGAGSRTADAAGLYHYTVTTNQVKEADSDVDIGFHYVAVDSNGVPLDEDADGVPDYLEDFSGNGSVDSGETDWESATDLGLRVIITRPRSRTIIP